MKLKELLDKVVVGCMCFEIWDKDSRDYIKLEWSNYENAWTAWGGEIRLTDSELDERLVAEIRGKSYGEVAIRLK